MNIINKLYIISFLFIVLSTNWVDCNFSYSYKVSGGEALIIKDKINKILFFN